MDRVDETPRTETWGAPVDFEGGFHGPGKRRFITIGPTKAGLPFDRRGFFGLDMKPEVTPAQAVELWEMLERYVEEFTYTGPMVEGAPAKDATEPLAELMRWRGR